MLKDTQKLTYSLTGQDPKGNPVGPMSFDAPPAWGLSDPAMGDLVAAADGLTAELTPSGKLGAVLISVTASSGGKALAGQFQETITVGDVSSIGIQPGTPVDQPAA